jgi:transcription antitermination factor NusA-like protein
MTKICSICLKNDFLCNACSKKIQAGAVSEADVALSRALFKLGIEANFMKSVDAVNHVIVVSDKGNSGLLIGRAGRNAKRLSTMMGKNVRIIEHVNDEKMLIERVLGNPVLGINKIYGQNELYKIRLENRFKKRTDKMDSVVSKLLGKNVKFIFE